MPMNLPNRRRKTFAKLNKKQESLQGKKRSKGLKLNIKPINLLNGRKKNYSMLRVR